MKKAIETAGVIVLIAGCLIVGRKNVGESLLTQVTFNKEETHEPKVDDWENEVSVGNNISFDLESIPEFSGEPFVVLNENIPDFNLTDYTNSFEEYSDLDHLGRCGVSFANIGIDLMPTEEREPIGMIKPAGWHTIKYDCIDGLYLYNRCHMIGYQLTGENANEKNLITGTRYLNVEGMLPFENEVADYIRTTENHVLYRVTPIYSGEELIARGIQIEALSVEDNGVGISFNIYVYNNQPGVIIDYSTGDSHLEEQGQYKDMKG